MYRREKGTGDQYVCLLSPFLALVFLSFFFEVSGGVRHEDVNARFLDRC